jgi:hypothetical protein
MKNVSSSRPARRQAFDRGDYLCLLADEYRRLVRYVAGMTTASLKKKKRNQDCSQQPSWANLETKARRSLT